ncbi:MAG: DsrE family protein [Gammaproteobacteria bacterium]|nr:DsrE family protein [Gammaproteobacteria bacterium]
MTPVIKNLTTFVFTIGLLLASVAAPADPGGYRDDRDSCKNLEPYNGVTPIDVEFGTGAQAITKCLTVRHHAKVVISVETAFPVNALGQMQFDKATFLSNIHHMVRNYEMHGMTIGKDVDVVVVFSQAGSLLATTAHPTFAKVHAGDPANSFRSLVEYGLQNGFKFYLCQTASRSLGINMSNKIPGVNFVPGGQIAVADFEMQGYAVLRP